MDDRHEQLKRIISLALIHHLWRKELSVDDLADELGWERGDLVEAILGEEWYPTLETLAQVEALVGEDLITVKRSEVYQKMALDWDIPGRPLRAQYS